MTLNDMAVEVYTGPATGWIRGSVFTRSSIVINRGTADESTSAVPSDATFQLDNRSGNWNPRNPVGSYYGQIGKSTPVRATLTTITDTFARTVSAGWATAPTPGNQAWTAGGAGGTVSGSDTSVSGGFGLHSVPATAAYRYTVITGETYRDVDVRVDCLVPAAPVTGGNLEPANVIVRYQSSTNYYLTRVTIDPTQQVSIALWHVNGTILAGPAAVTGLTHTSGNTLRVRAQAEGQSLRAKVWDAATPEPYGWHVSGNYVQLGVTQINTAGGIGVRSGVASGNTNTSPVVFQYSNFMVSVPRFAGEVGSWKQGMDQTNQDKWVDIEAAGPLRRLGQGSAPLQSTLRRSIPTLSALVAYWPCEDGASSTSIASAFPGATPMNISGSPQLASDQTFVGSDALPNVNGSYWLGSVPPYTPTNTVQVRMLIKFPQAGTLADGTVLFRFWTQGTAQRWDFYYRTGGALGVLTTDPQGNVINDTGPITFDVDGVAARLGLWVSQSGSNLSCQMSRLAQGIGGNANYWPFTINSRSITSCYAVAVGPAGNNLQNTVVGHVTVENVATDIFVLLSQLNAFAGESVVDRVTRLASENNVAVDVYQDPTGTAKPALLGPQGVDTLLNLLNECATADMGQLCETRGTTGLLYITLGAHYNQTVTLTLDATAKQIAAPPQPVDDDQQTHNDITVDRVNGSSARSTLITGALSTLPAGQGGIGTYPGGGTVNVAADSQLPDIAGWQLHLGTVDAARYPVLPVKYVHPPSTASRAQFLAALQVTMPNKITVTDLEPDSILVLARGLTETHTLSLVEIDFNCVPGSPYETIILDNGSSRLDSDTTTVHTGVNSTATSLVVDIADGTLWTTKPADWPFDIKCGGERMTVTNVTGSTSPQTFTVTRSVNGVVKGHSSGDKVSLFSPVYIALGRPS